MEHLRGPFRLWLSALVAVPLLSAVSGWLFFGFTGDARSALARRIRDRTRSLLLPLAGLGAVWVQTELQSREGTEWDVPVQGYDRDGNPTLLFPDGQGGLVQARTPDGVSIAPRTREINTGTEMITVDQGGQVVSRRPIDVAVSGSETGALVASFPILGAKDDGTLLVDLTATFSGDIPAVTGRMVVARTGGIVAAVDPGKSYIERVRVHGDVLNIRSHLTYLAGYPAAPAAGPQPVSVVLGHSLMFLPEKPMAVRPYDIRVGYFPNEYSEFESARGIIYLRYGRPDDLIHVEDDPSAPHGERCAAARDRRAALPRPPARFRITVAGVRRLAARRAGLPRPRQHHDHAGLHAAGLRPPLQGLRRGPPACQTEVTGT